MLFITTAEPHPPINVAPAPDTAAPVDDRGFLAKYWMYLLPFFLMSIFSAMTNPPEQQGQGQQGQQGQGQQQQQQQGQPAAKKD